MLFNETFRDCLSHPGSAALATVSAEGKPHIANTWNKYLIITEDEKILIPCYGFHKTEKNAADHPCMELTLGSDQVQGKMGMGTGFLLTGTGRFLKEGELYERMKKQSEWISRVLVFSADSCRQII